MISDTSNHTKITTTNNNNNNNNNIFRTKKKKKKQADLSMVLDCASSIMMTTTTTPTRQKKKTMDNTPDKDGGGSSELLLAQVDTTAAPLVLAPASPPQIRHRKQVDVVPAADSPTRQEQGKDSTLMKTPTRKKADTKSKEEKAMAVSPLASAITNFKEGFRLLQQPKTTSKEEGKSGDATTPKTTPPGTPPRRRSSNSSGGGSSPKSQKVAVIATSNDKNTEANKDSTDKDAPSSASFSVKSVMETILNPKEQYQRADGVSSSSTTAFGRASSTSAGTAATKENQSKENTTHNNNKDKEKEGDKRTSKLQDMMDNIFASKASSFRSENSDVEEDGCGDDDKAPKEEEKASVPPNLDLPSLGSNPKNNKEKEQQQSSTDKNDNTSSTTATATASSTLGGLISSFTTSYIASGDRTMSEEQAHCFEVHTYKKPTNCDICNGLLVGLWSQGLQCKVCGMNVHKGEGIDGHDNCCAEALLLGCPGCRPTCNTDGDDNNNDSNNQHKREDSTVNVGEVISQMRQMAKDKPNFLQDVKAQIDRDIGSHVKGIITKASAEEQKTKSLLRARNILVPFLAKVDSFEVVDPTNGIDGPRLAYGMIFAVHLGVSLVATIIAYVGFRIALIPTQHGLFTRSSHQLAMLHNTTVMYATQVSILIVTLLLRKLIQLMNRKSKVLDHFLREVLKLEAQEDLGVSVHGLAQRLRLWIHRINIVSAIMTLLALLIWQACQPAPTAITTATATTTMAAEEMMSSSSSLDGNTGACTASVDDGSTYSCPAAAVQEESTPLSAI